MNPTLIVALVGVILAPLVTYVVAARQLSGKISTSTASDLWQESAAIREEYRQRIDSLEDRLKTLEDENRGLKDDVRRLVEENATLRRLDEKLDQMKTENETLNSEVERLRAEHRRCLARIAELEKATNGG